MWRTSLRVAPRENIREYPALKPSSSQGRDQEISEEEKMAEYVIQNDFISGPFQGIERDKTDILIKDGKNVEKALSGTKKIDCDRVR